MPNLLESLTEAETGCRELSDRVLERFVSQTRAMENGCIEWTGRTTVNKQGRKVPNVRGKFSWASREWLCHRLIWTWLHGTIPEGLHVCHHCDNSLCVNPDHLMLGTHRLNMRDMKVKGRYGAARYPDEYQGRWSEMGKKNTWTKGAGNPKAKLTAEQAKAIKDDKRATRFVMADYGISRSQVQKIRRGDHWSLRAGGVEG